MQRGERWHGSERAVNDERCQSGKITTIVVARGTFEDVTQFGARLEGLVIDEGGQTVVAHYELVDAAGTVLGGGGEVSISFAALDVIDARLGGTKKLTVDQRLDLVAKFMRPLIVATFEPQPAPVDCVVNAHGVHVDARRVLGSIHADR